MTPVCYPMPERQRASPEFCVYTRDAGVGKWVGAQETCGVIGRKPGRKNISAWETFGAARYPMKLYVS